MRKMAGCLARHVLLCGMAATSVSMTAPASADAGKDNPPAAQSASASVADPLFAQPYIDVDEWRDGPVRYRYVHGGFTGTDARFSFYLPPKDKYEGRFFQYITPVPDSENLSQGLTGEEDRIGFALSSGAYFIETNSGGQSAAALPGKPGDPTIGAFRANAAAAQYSRVVAQQMYGGKRPYGYAFGGSGGAFRTLAGMENTDGVWDGAVPYVVGSPMALPNLFTARMLGLRVLDPVFPKIVDAIDAGGSGDPYAGLNKEQAATLREVTKLGFPPAGWFNYKTLGMHAYAVIYPVTRMLDPGYFNDFWTKPGYDGYARLPSLLAARVQLDTTVAGIVTAGDAARMNLPGLHQPGEAKGLADNGWKAMEASTPVAIRLTQGPGKEVMGGDFIVTGGAAAGSKAMILKATDDVVLLGQDGAKIVSRLAPGDTVRVDNTDFLASETYHRHQVPPGDQFPEWDQFRGPDGKPIYPQRPTVLGPLLSRGATGTAQTGKFSGKMIMLENLYDTEAFPWQGDWYRQRVRENLGAETDARYRLWMNDHANHGDSTRQVNPTHTVSYIGILEQALRDLAAWVEDGVEPAQTTDYRLVDGQIVVPPAAAMRRGIQPVVSLTGADGKDRVEARAGKPVAMTGVIEVPPGMGKVVSAEWDFDGAGTFPVHSDLGRAKVVGNRVTVTMTHSFAKPGTYFVTLRAASQRDGDAMTPFARVQNLDRVRVVVR